MRFQTIAADPPWKYRSSGFATGSWSYGEWGQRHSQVAANEQYPVLALEEIAALPVARFAQADAYLWLWTPSEHFRNGDHLVVCEAWGFTVKGERVWKKDRFGMGYWLRYNHEYLVFATRGSPSVFHRRDLESCIEAPSGAHSRKPAIFYEDIEDACGGPYLELFARSRRPEQLDFTRSSPRWTIWGNEVGDPLGIGFDPSGWKEAAA